MLGRLAILYSTLSFAALPAVSVSAQAGDVRPQRKPAEPQLPSIADQPKMIDPATLMPQELAVSASHDFADSSLREVVDWLQNDQGLVVLLDQNALSSIGVSPAEPISDRLDQAPIYLLLNRLGSLELAWYFEDEILHITSHEAAEERATTLPYNVGDLLDAGYELDTLETVLTHAIAPDSWEEVGGAGVLSSLGDVLFVRQNARLQRQVQGLLAALRQHARQTFVNDPPQHQRLRERLQKKVNVQFFNVPLVDVIETLASRADIDIRLDLPALRQKRVREREPVTLTLSDRKLETVLQAIVLDLELTWILRDGVLWVTSGEEAAAFLKTAVYDVRDLCRDARESDALVQAVTSQTEPASWDTVGGPGSMEFVKPGTVVISHQERVHMEVLQLLETYRTALRSSRFRDRSAADAELVTTVYYRLHAGVADSLAQVLPQLVRPESWKDATRPQAPGEILRVTSRPELLDPQGKLLTAMSARDASGQHTVVARAVLIIQQTRAGHDEIAEVIRRVEFGDASGIAGGLGGGGGSFGGGFFAVPHAGYGGAKR